MTAAVFTTAASLKTAASAAGAAIAGISFTLLGPRGLFYALATTQLLAAATTIHARIPADRATLSAQSKRPPGG